MSRRLLQSMLLGALALAFVAAAGWVWLASAGSEVRLMNLRAEGDVAVGIVTDVTVSAGYTAMKYGRETQATYFVSYQFIDQHGSLHQGMTSGSGQLYATFGRGGKIEVHYMPEQPEVHAFLPPDGTPRQSPIIVIGLLFGAAAACVIGAAGIARRRPVPVSAR